MGDQPPNQWICSAVVVVVETTLHTLNYSLMSKIAHSGVERFYQRRGELLFNCLIMQIILVFVTVRVLSTRVSDRVILLVGLILELATVAFFLWFIPSAKSGALFHRPCLIHLMANL